MTHYSEELRAGFDNTVYLKEEIGKEVLKLNDAEELELLLRITRGIKTLKNYFKLIKGKF